MGNVVVSEMISVDGVIVTLSDSRPLGDDGVLLLTYRPKTRS
jgi:hypothetical protein